MAVVPSFRAAVQIARDSDLVALVAQSFMRSIGSGGAEGLRSFALPIPTAEIVISQMWHPRMNTDAGHRWLRRLVLEICGEGKG